MSTRTDEFIDAWHWLMEHPRFKDGEFGEQFDSGLDILIGLHGFPTVCLEHGPWMTAEECWPPDQWPDRTDKRGSWSADYDLDSNADTFEEAIIIMADKVKAKYGDYVQPTCDRCGVLSHRCRCYLPDPSSDQTEDSDADPA